MQGPYKSVVAANGHQWRAPPLHRRFEQGKNDFIENINDVRIHYDGGRVTAKGSLVAEISERGLRKTTKETGLDRKTIRAILNGKKVKASTLAKVVTVEK